METVRDIPVIEVAFKSATGKRRGDIGRAFAEFAAFGRELKQFLFWVKGKVKLVEPVRKKHRELKCGKQVLFEHHRLGGELFGHNLPIIGKRTLHKPRGRE